MNKLSFLPQKLNEIGTVVGCFLQTRYCCVLLFNLTCRFSLINHDLRVKDIWWHMKGQLSTQFQWDNVCTKDPNCGSLADLSRRLLLLSVLKGFLCKFLLTLTVTVNPNSFVFSLIHWHFLPRLSYISVQKGGKLVLFSLTAREWECFSPVMQTVVEKKKC